MENNNPEQPNPVPSASSEAVPGRPFPSTSGGSVSARRGVVKLVALLYACSLVAAAAVLLRGGGGAESYLPGAKHLLREPEGVVGWVSINGEITGSEAGRSWERGTEQWRKHLIDMADRKEVKAIVLDIDSPGGSVGAVQELYQTIERIRAEKKKPIVAHVSDMAASGGYYLACACDKVVADPGSLVGSIGVIMETMNVEGLLAKLGVKSEPIKSGKLKDIGSPTRPMTKEEKALLQGIIDDTYGQFLEAVAHGRNLPVDKVRPLADGRIFNGRQALGLGMIDQLGDAHDALLLAGKLGGIAGTPKVLHESDSISSVLELLDSKLSDAITPQARLMRQVESLTNGGLEYRWTGFR